MTAMKIEYDSLKGSKKLLLLDEIARELDWKGADFLMRSLSSRLHADSGWRLGGQRIKSIFANYAEQAQTHLGRYPVRYLDFCAGQFQPLAFSMLFWFHGAERCVALDPDPALVSGQAGMIASRTAKSLWDIACEVLADPSAFHLRDDRWIAKMRQLDAAALRGGDLEAGIAHAPLTRHCGFIDDLPETDGEFDFVTSQAVLEHVHGFDQVAANLYRRSAKGGVHFHDVDFRDHRSFKKGDKFGKWDFLFTEDGDNGVCNRLRISEVVRSFEAAGFTVLDCQKRAHAPPPDIRHRLVERFKGLSDDDLATTSARVFLKKE